VSEPSDLPKKASRLGLWGPIGLVAILFCLWSVYWFVRAKDVELRLIKAETELKSSGFVVEHTPIKVSGYPYRMYIEFKGVKLIAPDGRGIEAPLILMEANAYALDKWVLVAKDSFIWHRQDNKGAVLVKGEVLRASISHLLKPIPQIAIEWLEPRFTTLSGKPFALSKAERFEAYLRANPIREDTADVLWRIQGARFLESKAVPAAKIGAKPTDKPQMGRFDWHIEASLNHFSELKDVNLSKTLAKWTQSGGKFTDIKASLKQDELSLFITSDQIGLDEANYIKGSAKAELSGKGDGLALLENTGLLAPEYDGLVRRFGLVPAFSADKGIDLKLDFKDGGTFLGDYRLSEAPYIK